jgi:hypothetical protein
MPINFVGEWCADPNSNDPADKSTSWYQLPSWTEDGHCTGILSITPYDFYISGKWDCDPVGLTESHDTAPSGTAYTAQITARCQPEGVTVHGEGPLRTFKLYRYKGRLSLTSK